jgi:hypothetical protein
MSDHKTTFAKRLKIAMEAAGYQARPSVLEREFNSRHWGKPMTLHGVRRWLLGETMPRNDKIVVLANWLGVTSESLGFGDGDTLREADQRQSRKQDIGQQERELLEAVMSLPVTHRRMVREIVMSFARDTARERESQDGRSLPARRPTSSRAAPAPEDLSATVD